MNELRAWSIGLFLYLSGCLGCSNRYQMEVYKETIRDGVRSIPFVQDIVRMFPNDPTDHFITHYGFERDKPVVWNTEVFFGGRWILTCQVDVVVDYERQEISGVVSQPLFYLRELSSIGLRDGEFTRISKGYYLNLEEWTKVVAAGGDFAIIGVELSTNAPLPGWNEHIRRLRAPRVQVDQRN